MCCVTCLRLRVEHADDLPVGRGREADGVEQGRFNPAQDQGHEGPEGRGCPPVPLRGP